MLRLYLIFFSEEAGGEEAVRKVVTSATNLQAYVGDTFVPVAPEKLLWQPSDPEHEECVRALTFKASCARPRPS